MACKIVIWIFAAALVLALFAFLTGTFGWFGQAQDPLSGIFLIPLGLPWNLIDPPDPWPLFVGLLAPFINLGLLIALCRYRARKRR